jgi:hypothetical protein
MIGKRSFVGEWLLLAYFFTICFLLLLDSTLQGSGPAPALGPFGSSWFGSYLLLVLVCQGFAMLVCCICGWIYSCIFLHCSLHRILLR